MNTPRTLRDWLDWIERQHPATIAMGLERVADVAARMDLPRPARRVITVAGTNGKGSTVAFIEAIARAGGWQVGAYTSPHLLAYNERVRIRGRDASDAELVSAFEAVEAARGEVPLTYFEYGTLAALWLFAQDDLDLVVLEVGLGGRLDATNIVDPDVAVVTTVDLDHQDFLGDHRERIGAEKVGIARPWKPLVLGEDDPPSSVLGHAYAIGASAIRIGCDFFFEPPSPAVDADPAATDGSAQVDALAPATGPDEQDDALPSGHWRWHEVGYALVLPPPRLAAPSQLRNAATAIAALRALDADLPDVAYAEGVAAADAPARLQVFARAGVDIVVDVAHNPQAARELAGWLRQAPLHGRTFAVLAALGDKDVAGVVAPLEGLVDAWHLAGLAREPRGLEVDAFAGRLSGTAAGSGARHPDVPAALAAARTQARAGDRILVFGSFHTAAAAITALRGDG